MEDSSYSIYSARNPQLPERFGEAEDGRRGLEVPIAFPPYLEKVYIKHPHTFVGMVYMNAKKHLATCQRLGQVI